MGGKTLPQFSIPAAVQRGADGRHADSPVKGPPVKAPLVRAPSTPPPRSSGTTRVGRGDLALEAARNLVRAARTESAILPRGIADALEALADSLVALDRAPSAPPPAAPDARASERPSRPSEPDRPTMEIPAVVDAWWQIEAELRGGQTRYVARWLQAIGPEGAVVEERECDGLSDSLQTVLGRHAE